MLDIKLETGDVFCTSNPQSKFIGIGIKLFQKLWAKDGEAEFGHSGIILNSKGKTFEALWKVRSQNIYKDYKGQNVIIARPTHTMTNEIIYISEKRKVILNLVKEYVGKWYPVWRLPMFMLGPIFPKYIHILGKPVCSELTAKYLASIKARYPLFWGTDPDNLADEFVVWKNYDVIYKGIIK